MTGQEVLYWHRSCLILHVCNFEAHICASLFSAQRLTVKCPSSTFAFTLVLNSAPKCTFHELLNELSDKILLRLVPPKSFLCCNIDQWHEVDTVVCSRQLWTVKLRISRFSLIEFCVFVGFCAVETGVQAQRLAHLEWSFMAQASCTKLIVVPNLELVSNLAIFSFSVQCYVYVQLCRKLFWWHTCIYQCW